MSKKDNLNTGTGDPNRVARVQGLRGSGAAGKHKPKATRYDEHEIDLSIEDDEPLPFFWEKTEEPND